MAGPAWLKKYLRMKPEVAQIFEDLEKYKEFCVTYGYIYDERHLYNDKTPWGEFERVQRRQCRATSRDEKVRWRVIRFRVRYSDAEIA